MNPLKVKLETYLKNHILDVAGTDLIELGVSRHTSADMVIKLFKEVVGVEEFHATVHRAISARQNAKELLELAKISFFD